LDPRSRELIQLKFNEELSYKEISARTGLSTGNVGYLLHHALKSHRRRAGKEWNSEMKPITDGFTKNEVVKMKAPTACAIVKGPILKCSILKCSILKCSILKCSILKGSILKGSILKGSILKGLCPPAQGCEERATLGNRARALPTLKGLQRCLAVLEGGKSGAATLSGLNSRHRHPPGSSFLATLGFETESLWDSWIGLRRSNLPLRTGKTL